MAKLTTAEILALARKQDAGESEAQPASAVESKPEAVAPKKSPVEESTPSQPSPEPGPRPASTAEILAKARAQAGGTSKAKATTEKKPAAAATPKSTKDILAAARAQAGGVSPAASAEKQSPQKKAAPKQPGERPSVQEMLKQARGAAESDDAVSGDVAETKPSAAAKPSLPPRPQKPAPSKVRANVEPRRNVLLTALTVIATPFASPFAAAWTAFTTASIAATLGMARFMMPNVIVEPPSKFKVGLPEDYPLGTVTTKWKSEFAIWITHQVVNGQPELYALSTVCTHLGCTPNWLEGEQKFKCPCHGSGFYPDGVNFEGPAPRPLERYGITIASDGMLEVDKSVKFQKELGQWNDEASFVATG